MVFNVCGIFNETIGLNNMDVNTDGLFKEQDADMTHLVLAVDVPQPQRAITTFPDNFQIRSMSDIRIIQEVVAHNYTTGIKLYRGHESKRYLIESTIVRLVKQNHKEYSTQAILDAEKKGFELFCQDVFKEQWLQNKSDKTDTDLFKMSIGRHLGLPCRLLDVTASLEIAVWFAVMNPLRYNEDGEVILFVLDENETSNISPFQKGTSCISHVNESFYTYSLNDLPLGEQRRFIQKSHFIWVNDNFLLNEQQAIYDFAFHIKRFTIPWTAKLSLATELYRDVYSGCAYQADIMRIKNILHNTH